MKGFDMDKKREALIELLYYCGMYRDSCALPPEIEDALQKYEAIPEQPDSEPVAWIDNADNCLILREDWYSKYKGAWVRSDVAIPSSWTPVLYTYSPEMVPDGYIVAPLNPTYQMVDAFNAVFEKAYIAMMAAAPQPESKK